MNSYEVKKIATLARLSFSDEQLATMGKDLSDILDLVKALQAENTEGFIPHVHPLKLTHALRSDTVTESNQREDLQQLASEVKHGHYLVPKVID